MKRFWVLLCVLPVVASGLSATHVLTDDEVVVVDGVIESCSYHGADKNIIIPDTLDGQAVTAIADGKISDDGVSPAEGVFAERHLTGVVFPATLKSIGFNAFKYCPLDTIDLSRAKDLERIGNYAFSGNEIDHLDLSACENLVQIEECAFIGHRLSSLDLSACGKLEMIDSWAFAILSSTPCRLKEVNLSGCHALTFIGRAAFGSDSLVSIVLPVHAEYDTLGWKDQAGNSFSGGDAVGDFSTYYYIPATYTLKDEDVVLDDPSGDGDIGKTTYNFALKILNIPDTLDGQAVKMIYGGRYDNIGNFYPACFTNKGLIEVFLPSTLDYLDQYAFAHNEIAEFEISHCTSLTWIGRGVVEHNPLLHLVLPVHAEYDFIGWIDGGGNRYKGGDTIFDQPEIFNIFPYYSLGIPDAYTIRDNDVEVENGIIQSCEYDFSNKNIIIPDTLDGQAVTGIADGAEGTGGVFASKGIQGVSLPASLNYLGDDAFQDNEILILDPGKCPNLQRIGARAFAQNLLEGIALPASDKPGYQLLYWEDGTGSQFKPGSFVTDLAESYTAVFEEIRYTVVFTITDGTDPLQGALVTLEGYEPVLTDSVGQAIFPEVIPSDSLVYSVEARGFIDFKQSIHVWEANLYEIVQLLREKYKVTITVLDESGPISGAYVQLGDYGVFSTDASGQVQFSEVLSTDSILFAASAFGYEDTIGTIAIFEDVHLDILLNQVLGRDEHVDQLFSLYPNPADQVVQLVLNQNAVIRFINTGGQLVLSRNFDAGSYSIRVDHLHPGIYIAEIQMYDMTRYCKIVVN